MSLGIVVIGSLAWGGATLLYAGLRFLRGYLLRRHRTPPERDPDHPAPDVTEEG